MALVSDRLQLYSSTDIASAHSTFIPTFTRNTRIRTDSPFQISTIHMDGDPPAVHAGDGDLLMSVARNGAHDVVHDPPPATFSIPHTYENTRGITILDT